MKTINLLLFVLLLLGCKEKPIKNQNTNNPNFQLSYLFEVDGCKVYRFFDGSESVYLTTCKGKVSYEYDRDNTTYRVQSLTEEVEN
ncbi:DUF4884 domain-containing protein [Spirosoma sp. KNUC1025]|uniref:DUF4884 domain-containing protein n=1 Tax=Spirosoma sp. KNUC1025 TaxID=2894082 RepID=UPI0038683328|nr:DUF4884 domain-containing protein [Spirosoma sp. KNUC1025]